MGPLDILGQFLLAPVNFCPFVLALIGFVLCGLFMALGCAFNDKNDCLSIICAVVGIGCAIVCLVLGAEFIDWYGVVYG